MTTDASHMPQTLEGYVAAFFRRWKLFAGPAVLVMALSPLSWRYMPRVYQASSLVQAGGDETVNPLDHDPSPPELGGRVRTLTARLNSWEGLVELSKRMGLDASKMDPARYEKAVLGLSLGGGTDQEYIQQREQKPLQHALTPLAWPSHPCQG